MDIKSVQTTLSQIVEAAGESGVTDEQVAKEITAKYRVSHFEAMNALQSTQKKEPEESTAVRLAKKLGKQNMGEKGRMEIMKHYTR